MPVFHSASGFGAAAIRETFHALGTANLLRGLSLEQQRDLLDLFTRSAGEMLDERFEHDLVKALFGFDAIVGNYASPYAAGSAYVMLHHHIGDTGGQAGAWGFPRGGMGGVTAALAAAARSLGAEIRTEAEVARIRTRAGRVTGVTLATGEDIDAATVVTSTAVEAP